MSPEEGLSLTWTLFEGGLSVGRIMKRTGLVRAGAVALVVVVLGVVVVNWTDAESRETAMDCERFSRVVLMGFSVAHPDYRMKYTSGPADECRPGPPPDREPPSFNGSLTVEVGPRVAGTGDAGFPGLRAEFRQEPSGDIRVPRAESWYLTELLNLFGSEDAGAANRQTLDVLKGLRPQKHLVHALVELREPLSEEEASKIYPIGIGEAVLLSPGRGKKPVGWSFPFPGVIGGFDIDGEGTSKSRVGEFQRWVSLLRPEDEPMLDEIGLDLSELRSHAGEGRVHGFTMMNSPGVIKSLVRNPKVHSVRVIDIVPGEWLP